ncbi:TlyA family RNA methyltransferase [Patescibacteria group bacterium]
MDASIVRLDRYLVNKSLVESREKAKFLIESGKVTLNSQIAKKPSLKVKEGDTVEVKEGIKYVSRSGMKLEAALNEFNCDVKGFTCLDIGSSTGGFTDCLLQKGALKVYAVDVGRDQLHKSLRSDERVISFEGSDIRGFSSSNIKEELDLIVIDVSFISICEIIDVLKQFSSKKTRVIALIKPQFEVGKRFVKKGIVNDADEAENALQRVRDAFKNEGFSIKGEIKSPLKGKEGNQEYLFYANY